jgi:hypothetical protein
MMLGHMQTPEARLVRLLREGDAFVKTVASARSECSTWSKSPTFMFPRPGFVRPIAVPAVSLYASRKQEKRAVAAVDRITPQAMAM